MRIYTNEKTGKHYINYSAAVLSLLEDGFTLQNNVDRGPAQADGSESEDKGAKATFYKHIDAPMFGADEHQYAHISYIDTVD